MLLVVLLLLPAPWWWGWRLHLLEHALLLLQQLVHLLLRVLAWLPHTSSRVIGQPHAVLHQLLLVLHVESYSCWAASRGGWHPHVLLVLLLLVLPSPLLLLLLLSLP